MFIDGVFQGIISQYDPGILYQQLVWQISGLPYGEHTIKIVNLSEYTCVDGFAISTAEPETEAPTEAPTDPETEPQTDPETEPVSDQTTEAVTEQATEPTEDSATETVTEPRDTADASAGCRSVLPLQAVGVMSFIVVLMKRKQEREAA